MRNVTGIAISINYIFKGGQEQEIKLPGKFEVCFRCEGRGKHVNPAIDEHGITADEFAEDPEFEEAYFSGRYDVRCHECDGKNVVPVIDESRLSKFQKVVFKSHEARLRDDAAYASEAAAERRMGA